MARMQTMNWEKRDYWSVNKEIIGIFSENQIGNRNVRIEQLVTVLDLISETLDQVAESDRSVFKSTRISFNEHRESYGEGELIENSENNKQIKDIIDISNSSALISIY